MTALACYTFRARWIGFAGSLAAVALGVALFTAAGLTLAAAMRGSDEPPRWYISPSVVVAGPDGAGSTPHRSATDPPLPPGERGFVPAATVPTLSTVDGASTVIVDRAGYARYGPAGEAHPWAAGALHPVRMRDGAPPTRDDHVVVTSPSDRRPGDVITVATVSGPEPFTVSGVVDSAAAPALYVTDATAARLARDRIAAVVLLPRPGTDPHTLAERARAALGDATPLRVLTGSDRRGAELDPDAGLEIAAVSLVGTTAGVAGVVAAVVVSGTFAFTVAQRRREFALLRAAGATPGQVRAVVVAEAALVGSVAGVAGAVLGTVLAPVFAAWLARHGMAPSDFAVRPVWWAPAAGFALGLVVALAGASVAARRAARTAPVDALREASTGRSAMTVTRCVAAAFCLGGVVPIARLMAGPAGAAYLLLVVLLLIMAGAMLLPALPIPVGTLLTVGRGAIAALARADVLAERRRYVSTAVPVLITIGLAGGALVGTATISATEAAALRHRLTASVVVTAAGAAALPVSAVERTRAVPGVAAAMPVKTTTVFDSVGGRVREVSAWYTDGPAAATLIRLPVAAGTFAELTDDSVAVNAALAAAHGWRPGARARLWLNDGAVAELRVVAVFADRLGLPELFLPWSLAAAHSTTPTPDAIYLAVGSPADHRAVDAAVTALGGTALPTAQYLTTLDSEFDRLNRLALLTVLGATLVYTAISIANTQLIATTGRRRELATLRRIGATRGQVRWLLWRGALTVWSVGVACGGLVTVGTLIAIHAALGRSTDAVSTRVPVLPLLAVVVCCGAITVAAGVAPAWRPPGRRP
ncbi:hypothetical protein Val02_30620 [Virgisporangium aliadipatigenens]|uniref:ABC3 transporter permease C-terminal domain-containing protein n=1 Tax=Virgisporangium aliadipatigenens TaxID=741659 RepID=A0A8J3YLQ4_9ACTN|nr:ABC transporter permease [Virgisporangium aliadipatigenens]GIJ46176.1 hypothetical protein Val02_30620 [Virgisporangium aliadipatigenens]